MYSRELQGCRDGLELTSNCRPTHEATDLCEGTDTEDTDDTPSHVSYDIYITESDEERSDENDYAEMFASIDCRPATTTVHRTESDYIEMFSSIDWRTGGTTVQRTTSCWDNCNCNCCLLMELSSRQESCTNCNNSGNECGSIGHSCYCGGCRGECYENCSAGSSENCSPGCCENCSAGSCENCSLECCGDCCGLFGACIVC